MLLTNQPHAGNPSSRGFFLHPARRGNNQHRPLRTISSSKGEAGTTGSIAIDPSGHGRSTLDASTATTTSTWRTVAVALLSWYGTPDVSRQSFDLTACFG